MTARKISSLSQLRPGAFGILEPRLDAAVFPASEIDLILVPGLAFDPQGHRLGRGKGYYDRFLPETRGKTMGICSYLVPRVPVEAHDCKMDAVVTEGTIIFCEMEDDSCGMTSGS
jgi:5-formyltetrahydrofolate cyclo-ligase